MLSPTFALLFHRRSLVTLHARSTLQVLLTSFTHAGSTLQDLTEAALEEIERQEAAMETTEALDGSVVEEIVQKGSLCTCSVTLGTG